MIPLSRKTLTNIKVALLAHKDETGEPEHRVAAKLGVHPYILSQYATGQVAMPLGRRVELAKILGVPPDTLNGVTDFEVED